VRKLIYFALKRRKFTYSKLGRFVLGTLTNAAGKRELEYTKV
jgi:hypothetical protein